MFYQDSTVAGSYWESMFMASTNGYNYHWSGYNGDGTDQEVINSGSLLCEVWDDNVENDPTQIKLIAYSTPAPYNYCELTICSMVTP